MRFRFVVTSAVLRGLQAELDADQPITVGRVGGNRLVLDHKSVSRHHARLVADGSGLRLIDLKSHNGTRVGEELVSERQVQPGDILGFGEIRLQFIAADAAGAGAAAGCASPTATASAGLPVLASAAGQGMALAQPLNVEDIFGVPAAGQTAAMPTASPVSGTLLYILALVAVLVVGAIAYWKVGLRPPKLPILDVGLRAGDVLPLFVGPRYDPANERWLGVSKIASLGESQDQNIAYAKTTPFRGFIVVHGQSVGTTDVRIEGPDQEYVILRILVRGVRPEPPSALWLQEPPADRRRRADELIRLARLNTPKGDIVDPHTSDAIRGYRLAVRLLEGVPNAMRTADAATREADRLQALLDAKQEELTRRTELLVDEGKYDEVEQACQELESLYRDPDSEEYHVVRHYHEFVSQKIAAARRLQDQAEKERR